jgi:hypothetical protein
VQNAKIDYLGRKMEDREGIISLDTLYLSIRYPHSDVFERWFYHVQDVDLRRLREGVVRNNIVIRTGGMGYRISLWKKDARAFLTPDTDQKRGEGKGMGIWLQLGPKFIISAGDNLHSEVMRFLSEIGVFGDHEIRISRLDIAIDLFDVEMKDQNLEDWHIGWVGRSKISSHHFNPRTGQLETINIGSRKSSVFLRIYDKIAQSLNDGDLIFWLDVWKREPKAVTRIEWEIKPREGNFQEDLRDFSKFCGFSTRELLNYLLDWGRLCIPDNSDQTRTRWKETDFWKNIRYIAQQWANGITWPTSRYGKEYKPITEGYIKFLAGTIAGGMARFNQDDPNLIDLFNELEKNGIDYKTLKKNAAPKAAIYKNI